LSVLCIIQFVDVYEIYFFAKFYKLQLKYCWGFDIFVKYAKIFTVCRLYDDVYFAAFLCQTAACQTTNGHVIILNVQFCYMTKWAMTSLLPCYRDAEENHEQVKKLCIEVGTDHLSRKAERVILNLCHSVQFNSFQFNSVQFNSV
jgi:hypothetical protein